ncbi:MAG TPA: hypothetical protein VKD69_22480 [Vicinamibacterales bacterium]|nr:hypothetical protein [Vicinamibacterales bacterium]
MNERIRIAFRIDGTPLPVQSFDSTGLRFDDEIDCWPRTFLLEFDANNQITRTRMEWVRQRWGWNPGLFNLQITLDQGTLLVTGADARSLPAGSYWLEVRVNGMIVRGGSKIVSIDDDKEAALTLDVSVDPRRVVLERPVADWDAMIRGILLRSGQTFDGMPIADWLTSHRPRECRKACLINLLAKLRTLPDPDEPFLAHVRRIFHTDVERIYVETDDVLLTRLRDLSNEDERPFYDEGTPASPDHLRLLTAADSPDHELESFRQDGRDSMQVVVAYPPGSGDGRYFADVDIDLGNPLRDVEGFVIHMGELLSGTDTDHIDLHDVLARSKQPTAPYIYYDVKKR